MPGLSRQLCSQYYFTAIISFFVLAALFLACEIVYWVEIPPMTRGFDAGDITIAYSKRPDTVDGWLYVGICESVPPVLIIIFEVLYWYFKRKSLRRDWRIVAFVVVSDLLILFFIGLGVTVALTNLLKYVVARPRPYFLESCKPDYSKIGCDQSLCVRYPYCPHCGLIDYTKFGNICTGKTSLNDDIWLSFPSLHASHVTYAMAFLILYIQYRIMAIKYFAFRFTAVAAVIQGAAFTFILFTCSTRVADNRHHWSDVVGGIVLALTTLAWVMHSADRSTKLHETEHKGE